MAAEEDATVPTPQPNWEKQKTVLLHDWWLMKVEKEHVGRKLSVGGFAGERQLRGKSMRTFSSSPIIKRHDAYTLETADGMIIRILGFINKKRTLDNGFSLEVCRTFLTGFPTTWVNLTNESSGSKSSRSEAPESACGSAEFYVNSSKKITFEFPVQSENGIANITTTSSTPVCGSTTLLDAIQKFVAHLSVPNTAHMASKGREFCDFPNENTLAVCALQDDETIGINMRSDDTVDNDCDYYEAGHIEGAECQTHDSHVDGVRMAKKASRRSTNSMAKSYVRRMRRLDRKKKHNQIGRSIKKEKKDEVSKVMEQEEHKESCTTSPKTIRMPSYKDVHNTPLTRSKGKTLSISLPVALNLKRSKSGRLLVPRLDSSSRILYEADGSIAGIIGKY